MSRVAVVIGGLLLGAASPVLAYSDGVHWTLNGPLSVTIDWRGDDTVVSYGPAIGALTRSVHASPPVPMPDDPGPHHEARITGLLPGTHYVFQIGNGDYHSFETPPRRGSSGFWFAQEADVGSSHTYPPVAETQVQIASDESAIPGDDSPAFVLVTGDLTYGDQGDTANIAQHFNDVMVWSRHAAYMPAWGNHEWDPVGSTLADQVNNYKGRFALPNARRSPGTGHDCIANDTAPGEDWYWFDYGNVRFIAAPSQSDGACGYVGARVAWRLAADSLMAQVDDDPTIRFVVTFGHFPPFSSGADHVGNPLIAADLALLRSSHPKYVLHLAGHSHHYERFDPNLTNGVQQIVSGGGGSTLGGLGTPLPSTLVRLDHTQHLKVHVTADRIEGFAVCGPDRPEQTDACAPGTLFDHWTIESPVATTDAPPLKPPAAIRAGWYDVLGRRVEPGAPGAYFRPGRPRVIVR